jgi:hypothetical protein
VRRLGSDRGDGYATSARSSGRLDYQLFQLRAELASFDVQLAAFLASPHGRFETFYAERERLRVAR